MLNKILSKYKTKTKEEYIYEYMSCLFYYTLLFQDEYHQKVNYTKKSEMVNQMMKIYKNY